MRFADINVPTEQVKDTFLPKADALLKLHITGTEVTLEKFMNFSADLIDAFYQLSAKRIPLMQILENLKTTEANWSYVANFRDSTMTILKEFLVDGAKDQTKEQSIRRILSEEMENLDRLNNQRNDLKKALHKEVMVYVELCVRTHKDLTLKLLPVLTNIRDELNLPIDSDLYQDLMINTSHRHEKSFKIFQETISGLSETSA